MLKRKMLAIVMTVAMVISLIPAMAFAGIDDYDFQGDWSDTGRYLKMAEPERVSFVSESKTEDGVTVYNNKILNIMKPNADEDLAFKIYQDGGTNENLEKYFDANHVWIENANGEKVEGVEPKDVVGNNSDKPKWISFKFATKKVITDEDTQDLFTAGEEYVLVFEKNYGGTSNKGVNRFINSWIRFSFIYDGVSANKVVMNGAVEKTITKGETAQLTATVQPNGNTTASNQNVIWKSEDPSIATVDQEGNVTGVGAGTVNIIAQAEDLSNVGTTNKRGEVITIEDLTATCAVTVNVNVESVNMSVAKKDMVLGSTFTLAATPMPADCTDKTIKWASNANGIASVKDGVVTAKNIGPATITATSANGKVGQTAIKVIPATNSIKLAAKKRAVKITYTKVPGATHYQIYRATKKNGKYKKVATRSATAKATWTNKKLKKGKKYYYKVRSYKVVNGVKYYSEFSPIKYKKAK